MGKPFEIVILSGKGGTGKTTITAAFASLAKNAVFTDCDVDAADLHLVLSPDVYQSESFSSGAKAVVDTSKCTVCGLCLELCRFDAISMVNDEISIDEFACEGCGLCSIACPAGAISIESYENNHIYFANCRFGPMIYGKLGIAEENSGKLVSKIRQYAKETAGKLHAEMIITDGPPGIGCPVISSVTGADIVVAVTEPTLSGWHDLERLIGLIGQFHTPIKVIINKYDLNKDMCSVIENNLNAMKIEILGRIPYDNSMVNALLESKTINEFEPDGLISEKLKKIWNKISATMYEPKSI
jgi:MinD superfamily P-loop ATPase